MTTGQIVVGLLAGAWAAGALWLVCRLHLRRLEERTRLLKEDSSWRTLGDGERGPGTGADQAGR